MIKIFKFLVGLVFLITAACDINSEKSNETSSALSHEADTNIVSQNVIHDIAGSVYLKRATAYFLVSKNDTSDFKVVFAEEKENGLVGINIRYDFINRKGKSFNKRMDEMKLILPKAKTEYNFDSLRNISVGRLVSTGDLAIKISQEYNEKYEGNYSTEDYNVLSNFLLESALAEEFNEILKPYQLVVSHISIEKAFFTSKKELYWASKIETDSLEIPDKILDCITWVRLRKVD